jgi:hypothetical protein
MCRKVGLSETASGLPAVIAWSVVAESPGWKRL